MIVVATDYQGLGTPGSPPTSWARARPRGCWTQPGPPAVLDGRAASNTVVVIGYSQGGQAALFAGQIAQSYAPELYLAGVVAIGPVTSLTELAPPVPGGDTDPDAAFAAMALYAWSATYGNLALASVFTQRALGDSADRLLVCGPVATAFDSIPTVRLFRSDGAPTRRWPPTTSPTSPGRPRSSRRSWSCRGPTIRWSPIPPPPGWSTDSLCQAQHDTVTYVPMAGASHSGALQQGASTVLHWIASRLAGCRTDWCLSTLVRPARGRRLPRSSGPTRGGSTSSAGRRGRRGGVRRRGSGGRRTPNPPRRPPHRPPPPGCRCRPPPTRPGTSGR